MKNAEGAPVAEGATGEAIRSEYTSILATANLLKIQPMPDLVPFKYTVQHIKNGNQAISHDNLSIQWLEPIPYMTNP
ncbi:hypothetical protein DSO57_1026057 [Entomophthora muscae]|uniref:Uncharacterized protein n=1 Tax=Entomophthora muscae TaxID=34485 RepID=A0ACC2SR95_9FUNG|nr:hypothetical protein DSO57_1026057 [Entomophthora muscae]